MDHKNVKKNGELTGDQKESAIDSLFAILPQESKIWIDGEEKDPAAVYLEYSDEDAVVTVE